MYTARLNEVVLAQLPMVYFKYETNPMTVLHILNEKEWHTLFIEIVGIIGGIFTVATIIDHLIHSSIHFLVKKHMLNKLRWSLAMRFVNMNKVICLVYFDFI